MDERNMILGLVVVLLAIGAYYVFAQVPGCTSDADCSPCDFCFFGDIAEGSCAPRICETTCPSGCVCSSGQCIPLPPPPECTTDNDCSGCESCIDNVCVDDSGNCGACEQCVGGSCSYQCGTCQVCQDNVCSTPLCQGDNECNNGCLCYDGFCAEVECVYDFHCGGCGKCVDTVCVPDNDKCGLCEYCEADGYECLPESCGGEAGTCPTGCICSGGSCQRYIPPPGPEGCTHRDMTATIDVDCIENVVTVKDEKGNLLSGVSVRILLDNQNPIDKTTTDGKITFEGIDGTARIILEKGYKDSGICYDAIDPNPASLKTTAECKPACGDGVVAQDEECEKDLDCSENFTCESCKCVALPPPMPPEPECSADADCLPSQYCSGGSCAPVQEGTCGTIENHRWKNYECCKDEDCEKKYNSKEYECKQNKCVKKEYDLDGEGGFTGDSSTVTAYISGDVYANKDLRVTKPDGSYEVMTTDSNGQITLGLVLAGEYTVDLLVNGTVVKTLTVTALPKTPVEPTTPTLFDVLAQQSWLLLLVLAILLFLVWRFYLSKGKGKTKGQKRPGRLK